MRRSCPQMPMRKAMGMSMISQNRKNRKRSSERKTPTTPTSSISNITKNSLTRLDIVPRREDRDGRQESSENNQKDAETIDSKMVVDGRRGDPGDADFQAVAGGPDGHAG